MKKLLITLSVLALVYVGAAEFAYALSGGDCERYTTCLLPSAGHVPGTDSPDARPSSVVETNSAAIFNVFVVDPNGTDDDTGTEVCALVGMDCIDVIEFAEGGASGDEMTAATCATDLSSKIGFVMCN